MFKRFYRSPEVENMEGSGIGLYLSNLILEKEKGYMTVYLCEYSINSVIAFRDFFLDIQQSEK